jgi:hypothetical protein
LPINRKTARPLIDFAAPQTRHVPAVAKDAKAFVRAALSVWTKGIVERSANTVNRQYPPATTTGFDKQGKPDACSLIVCNKL